MFISIVCNSGDEWVYHVIHSFAYAWESEIMSKERNLTLIFLSLPPLQFGLQNVATAVANEVDDGVVCRGKAHSVKVLEITAIQIGINVIEIRLQIQLP